VNNPSHSPSKPKRTFKVNKFVVGGLLMGIAILFLIVASLKGNTQYYLTIGELIAGKAGRESNLRISGVVLGDTIHYDPATLTLSFMVANIPGDNKDIEKAGGLAQVLHNAAIDPNAAKLKVVYQGEKPDLLKNEAQAIMTGSIGSDGVFYAQELLLKCPSRYEDSLPAQVLP
jgi:cytochrome c-type biogenesis protein CcmE